MKLLNKAIDMVCVFEKGNVSPIRFRIEENKELRVIKIKKVINRGNVKVAGQEFLLFTCMVEQNNLEQICEIRFNKISTTWFLYKI